MHDKKTVIQNITYMAIMAAINVIFSVLAMFLPLASLVLMLVLPLTSVIVVLFCKEKYFIIYAVSTILLCLLITMSDAQTTIFYVIPSIVSGFVFGWLIKQKIHAAFIMIISAAVQLGITYASLPLIQWIYGVNMIEVFKTLLHLTAHPYINGIIPTFFFILALAQATFSFIIIHAEIKKFGITVNSDEKIFSQLALCGLESGILVVISATFSIVIPYLLFLVYVFFSLFAVIDVLKINRRALRIVLGLSLVINLFLFAILYNLLIPPLGLLLLGLFLLPADALSLCNKYLLKPSKVDRI
ncbi:MAG: DUF2232 domain-containing protein [Firmicutes bacterium]|nr:DUF2232 domain-containing protein [Bacillota bacterium]